ncbi:2-dehydropantoate 2-reductase [Scleromatobacter humisilvae]|uniref:2-dehydropantoate 2-reductase n=1 Tax=Scleromatobacter humisilvae TaxID=2897159 RepID=A0A9X1YP77_9BURK|nr:2-dehydropantoate 2-reductase [Scleromatobacter humisilvae]MCK9688483.1 2-dehydropantoate 2-reductase [Scleromatobacter humisilvae]
MKILIVGAGSTGGYFGARLTQAGRDVTFLVRPARAAALRERGLQVLSPRGNFSVEPRLLLAGEIDEPFDIVLVTVKAFGLPAAIEDFAAAVGPETMILPVLNGMKHIDDLQARFGAERVVGGVCRVSTTLDKEGRIVHLAPLHELVYGELDGRSTARIEALHAFMSDAGFDAQLSTHIAQDLWNKWILLSTLGGICTLARGNVGEIAATDGGVDFVRAFLAEAAAVATAAGFAPSQPALDFILGVVAAPGSPMTSSMYRDLVGGERVEADQILGDLRARARRAGIETPLVSAAFIQLDVHQRRRATAQAPLIR